MISGACNAHQVLKAAWIVPRLDNCKSLEKLKSSFGRHFSLRETLHTLSKYLILEDGDSIHQKHPDPDTTSYAAATATGSDSPP